jgi:hypothetical protein
MRALAEAYPAFWFPVHLLDYVSQVCFGVFFYLFPTGRFVPSWTRWAALASAVFFVPDRLAPWPAVRRRGPTRDTVTRRISPAAIATANGADRFRYGGDC